MGNIVYEGVWDCSNCGKTRISYKNSECPICHDPQNSVLTPEEDWYQPENATVETDPEELATENLPSWNCGHCGQLNRGNTTVCSFCDKPLDYDDTVNRIVEYRDDAGRRDFKPDPRDEIVESDIEKAERVITTKAGPRRMKHLTRPASELPRKGRDMDFYEGIRADSEKRFSERQHLSQLPPIGQMLHRFRKPIIIGVAVLVSIMVIIGLIAGGSSAVQAVRDYNATVPGTVSISALHWERKVEVESLRTVSDSGWDHPADVRILSADQRLRSHRTVHDGYHNETYTDYESRPRQESYMGSETRYRSETKERDCSYTRSNGNGKFTRVQQTCRDTVQVPYQVQVPKTRTVYDQVPVQKTRKVEDTHQEPVYDIWYTYQYDTWVTARWVTASDATSKTLIWPEVTGLNTNDQSGYQLGEERPGDEKSASYTVVYVDSKGATHSEEFDDDSVWSKLKQDAAVLASYYQRNGDLASVNWASA